LPDTLQDEHGRCGAVGSGGWLGSLRYFFQSLDSAVRFKIAFRCSIKNRRKCNSREKRDHDSTEEAERRTELERSVITVFPSRASNE